MILAINKSVSLILKHLVFKTMIRLSIQLREQKRSYTGRSAKRGHFFQNSITPTKKLHDASTFHTPYKIV